MIEQMFNTGAMPALERLVQFTAARHKVIAHNVANLSTPGFRPRELDPADFQQALGEAIDRRRERFGGPRGDMNLQDTRQMHFTDESIELQPGFADDNILFHDRNNRSLEHQMKSLAENAMTHNLALEMMRNQFQMMRTAIRERV